MIVEVLGSGVGEDLVAGPRQVEAVPVVMIAVKYVFGAQVEGKGEDAVPQFSMQT